MSFEFTSPAVGLCSYHPHSAYSLQGIHHACPSLLLPFAIIIGVNISERKSGTERTKKRKKRELVFFPPPSGATGTVVHCLGATRILPWLR